jgi:peptide/nickel transport system substrate-binding protein
MKNRSLRTALLMIIVIIMSLGFSSAHAAKDSLVVADVFPVKNLDYNNNATGSMGNIAAQIWDPLLYRDPVDATLHPHLVTAWKTISPTVWEFTLRPGIKYHNGNPLNAECVRFTIEDRILNPDQKATNRSGWTWVKKVEVIDDLTFRIITEKPYPLILERFSTLLPYDPVHTKEKGDEYIQTHPMGTGPYKFVSFDPGEKVVLVANENYWKKGIPKIKNLTVRYIPETSTRLAELISGGVDVALRIPPDQFSLIEKNPKLKIIEKPVLRIFYWQFDAAGRASESPLTDVRVRRAFWHAIDRKTILDSVLGGHGSLVNIPVNPRAFAADPSLDYWKYEPEKAKALLEEAGYAQGFTVDCWIQNDQMNQISQAAAGYLEKVGIKLNFKDYRKNLGQLLKILYAGNLTGIMNMGFGSYGVFDPDAIMPWHFLSSASKAVYSKDPELEGWLTEARNSVDPELRKELYQKAQNRVIDQAYWLPWYIMHALQGVNKDLEYVVGVDERGRYEQAYWVK